jgi:serine/threonine protein kinase
VVLYQLLTGLKPFTGETMSLIMHQVVNVQPPLPSEINPELPKSLDTLLRKSLAKQLHRRFGSAAEFKKELLSAFKKIPSHTKTPSQSKNKACEQTILSKKYLHQAAEPPSKKPLYIVIAVVAILLLSGLIYFMGTTTPELVEDSHTKEALPAIIGPTPKVKKSSKRMQPAVKIIRPESKKISKPRRAKQAPQKQPATGISINGRKTKNDDYRSGNGIRITTPSRD